MMTMNRRIPDSGGQVPDPGNVFGPWQSAPILQKGERVSELLSGRSLGAIHVHWLVFFDLDNLYRFNELHGHSSGDALINAFWKLLLSIDRSSNYVTRYGGDEFVWLSSFSDQQLKITIRSVRDELLRLPENIGTVVGLSCAFAEVRDTLSPDAGQELFAKVSQCAQETAKTLGKDKIMRVGVGEPEMQDW